MTLHLLQYNNYYNRVIKFYDNLDDYDEYKIDGAVFPDINFIPNDGVSTQQIIDWEGAPPDYVIVEDDAGRINSRWYVVEAVRLRHGQYRLSLYRDLIVDFYDDVMEAPIFLEKGALQASNPLVFNQEDMTFNQIRQTPTLLYDRSECPWVVGYIPRDAFPSKQKITYSTGITVENADFEVDNISDWDYAKYTDEYGNPNHFIDITSYTGYRYSTMKQYENDWKATCKNIAYYVNKTDTIEEIQSTWHTNKNAEQPQGGYYNGAELWQGTYYYKNRGSEQRVFREGIQGDSDYQSYFNGFITTQYPLLNSTQYNEINDLSQKLIYDSTAKQVYRIIVKSEAVDDEKSLYGQSAIMAKLNSFANTNDIIGGGVATVNTFFSRVQATKVWISLEQIQLELEVEIDDDRYHLEDSPYDMFCIPFGEITIEGGIESCLTQSAAAYIAQAIGAAVGQDKIYDVQLLPYCPIVWSFFEGSNVVDLSKIKYHPIRLPSTEKDPDTQQDIPGQMVSAVLWCRSSKFQNEILLEKPINAHNYAINKKVESQTTKYRLVSPNYNGVFEFDPQKNDGVDRFYAYCHYRPFNPYIRVAPLFKGLYGSSNNNLQIYDARGLILGGDFSLAQISSAWANYEAQNKNYQAIFDRQIQNMEVSNKAQKTIDIFQAITGTVSGTVSGAMSGAMMGSAGGVAGMGIGAGIGGTLGGLASAGGGIADFLMNEKLRNEAIDYTKDNFGYQLGNIQAIPYSLAKTSAANIDSPLVPMLEKYSCSEEERKAFINKLLYNGMTIMAIGTLSEYVNYKETADPWYFKGKIIRFENLGDDTHIANAIANELNKGVYL